MTTDITRLLKRETQLNMLAYTIIVVLIAAIGVLVFVLLTGVQMPDFWLLRDHIFRTLVTGLLLMVILYLVDQHRRLRGQVTEAHHELEHARQEIANAYDRLAFAHQAAELVTSLTQTDGLEVVLSESVQHFSADAAAVVGDDITLTVADGVDAKAAHTAVLHAALETVRAGAPLTVSIGDGGSVAIAVPLRIQGALKSVVALWRSGSGFSADELEGLGLVARIIELGIENRMLLDEARSQLSGSLRAMVDLVEHRRPNYIPHTTQVADCAVMMGKAMGMRETEVADLRIAAMLQDVGMLEVPESIINAPRGLTGEEVAEVRQHPAKGAALVKTANFDVAVQHAVLFHHERLDGSGYPQGLTGDQIPLAARILAIADSYVAMISDRPHRPKMTPIAALNELRAGAGTAYDPRVVREFLRLQAAAPIATATAQTDVSTDPARVAMRGELAARPA